MSRLVAIHWDAASCVPAAVPAVVCFVDSKLERKLMLVVFFSLRDWHFLLQIKMVAILYI